MKNKNNHLTEIDCIGSCIKPKQKSKIKHNKVKIKFLFSQNIV